MKFGKKQEKIGILKGAEFPSKSRSLSKENSNADLRSKPKVEFSK